MMKQNINNLWYPFRWGVKLRRILFKFTRSYGSKFIFIRRPLVVFISSLLNQDRQDWLDDPNLLN